MRPQKQPPTSSPKSGNNQAVQFEGSVFVTVIIRHTLSFGGYDGRRPDKGECLPVNPKNGVQLAATFGRKTILDTQPATHFAGDCIIIRDATYYGTVYYLTDFRLDKPYSEP